MPGPIGQLQSDTLYESPVHYTSTQPFAPKDSLQSPVSVTCIFSDSRRGKLEETQEETHESKPLPSLNEDGEQPLCMGCVSFLKVLRSRFFFYFYFLTAGAFWFRGERSLRDAEQTAEQRRAKNSCDVDVRVSYLPLLRLAHTAFATRE